MSDAESQVEIPDRPEEEQDEPAALQRQENEENDQVDQPPGDDNDPPVEIDQPVPQRRRDEDVHVPHVRITRAIDNIVGGDSMEHLHVYINNLVFRSYQEQVNWTPQMRTCMAQESVEAMTVHLEDMVDNVVEMERSFGLLQHLQIGYQIHHISDATGKHPYTVARDLCQQDRFTSKLSYITAKKILKISWCIFKCNVLSQVSLSWTIAREILPIISEYLDFRMLSYQPLPESIVRAQVDKFSLCLRVSMRFPISTPGDGDGLPNSTITQTHGFYRNDRPTDEVGNNFKSQFRELLNAERTPVAKRSRLIGFDTQETPTPGDRVEQLYWEAGRDLLVSELNELKGNLESHSCKLLLDVYSTDLFGRILVDIRGLHRNDDNNPQPSIGRFEIARRMLLSGYAVPTDNQFTNETLQNAFQEARVQRRGGFADGNSFDHPVLCRRDRYQRQMRDNHRRRRRYVE